VLSCLDLEKQIVERDRAYTAIRGNAEVKSKDFSFDANIAARAPSDLRVEVSGPLGVKVGLLVMNKKWIQFFIPRKRLILRLPKSELDKNSMRAERFLSSIVLPLPPKQLVAAITTRSLIAEGGKVLDCEYRAESNSYRLAIASPNKIGGQVLEIDPTSFAPIILRVYDSLRPRLNFAGSSRYAYRVEFANLIGEGMAVIPSRAKLFSGTSNDQMVLEWDRVEVWNDPVDSAFSLTRNASYVVKDY